MHLNLNARLYGIALLVALLGCLLAAGERVRGILWNTCWLSGASATIAVPLGVIVALLLTKTDLPGRRPLLAAFAVLLFMPLYLHAAGWQAALGVAGWFTPQASSPLTRPWIDGWRGTIWIHAMAAVPWVVCMVAGALRWLPNEAEQAASLVVRPLRVLGSITLPCIAPAIGVAALWIAVSVAAEMTVTDFFQVRTFAEEVYTAAAMGGFQTDNPKSDYQALSPWMKSSGMVAGVGVLTLLALVVLTKTAKLIQRDNLTTGQQTWRWQLGSRRWVAAVVAALSLLLVGGVPLVSLVYKAGLGAEQIASGWQRVWSMGKLSSELAKSVGLYWPELCQTGLLALCVATAAVVLGAIAGWWLRTRRRPLILLSLFALALAMPGPVLGLAVIPLLNHPAGSVLSPLTWAYDYTLLAPWLVQTIRFTPIASLVLAAGFASVSDSLLDAARADGAGWWRRLLLVGLPLNLPMVAAAWLVVFALSVGELAATVLVMPPGTPTLTIRLFALLHYGIEDRVAAISLVLIAGVSLVATVAVWLAGRGRLRRQEPV